MTTGAALVRRGTVADARRVAELHAAELPEGFLSSLGTGFLRRLYARAGRSAHAFVLVAETRGQVNGFVAATEATGALYREFLLRDGIVAGLAATPAVLRSPRRTWETLRYGAGAPDGPRAEILAIAVDSSTRGTGTGPALLRAALTELRARGIDGAKVVTASTNETAIRMYERGGFQRLARTEVHAGVSQEMLVWRSS
jgi:ribosomal protein S18 acetylase RimI-like enzyme